MPTDPHYPDPTVGAGTAGDTPEERERAAAWRRGEAGERASAADESGAGSLDARRAYATVAARAFGALADNVRDYAIFLMDPEGVITFWGEGARLIKWWSRAQAEGSHLRLLYPAGGSDDGTADEHLREAAERGEYTGEGERIRSDGSTFWAGVTLTALWDEKGTLLGFAKVTRDLTARRAADALLQSAAAAAQAARADAEAASAAKSGFLATMSHEIRTPVNAIMGYLELLDLEIDGPLAPGQRRHLERAGASARHLLALITEVLDFSRIEAERMPMSRAVLRVGDVVASALTVVTPQARSRGVEIVDAVSGFAAGLAARGDEARVRQVLVNLLANAVKFTDPSGREPGRVTVSAGTATQASPDAQLSGEGPWVYVRVEDVGQGIESDRLQPIFEPFVQADMSLTRVHGGAGLGLAISRRLARLMGGDITVRSEVGMGSTFFVWLPAAPVESMDTGGLEGHGPGSEEAASRGSAPGGMPARGGPPHVLADALLAELERVLHALVARMRSDPGTPSARDVDATRVEDHLASFLTDIVGTLRQAPERADASLGEPSAELADGAAIQHVVAERHGAQRARLGWREVELRRELTILREELAAAVMRQAERLFPGPSPEARREEAERALEMLTQFVAVFERLSLIGYRNALGIPSS
jgi:PAS domain S-box-containing protein